MPNPYFNNQRTFIPNTLVKSDEVNSQFNDVENGFDLIDEKVTQIETLANNTASNTNQTVNQLIQEIDNFTEQVEQSIADAGGTLGGGTFPIGSYGYYDDRAPSLENHVRFKGNLFLGAEDFPELAAVIPPSNVYEPVAITQNYVAPAGFTKGMANYGFIKDDYYFVSMKNQNVTPNKFEIWIFRKVGKSVVLSHVIDTGRSANLPNTSNLAYQSMTIRSYEGGYLAVQFEGRRRGETGAIPAGMVDTISTVVVYQGQDTTWSEILAVFSPTVAANYTEANRYDSVLNATFIDRFGETAFVFGGNLYLSDPGVLAAGFVSGNKATYRYGIVYRYDLFGNLLEIFENPYRAQILSNGNLFGATLSAHILSGEVIIHSRGRPKVDVPQNTTTAFTPQRPGTIYRFPGGSFLNTPQLVFIEDLTQNPNDAAPGTSDPVLYEFSGPFIFIGMPGYDSAPLFDSGRVIVIENFTFKTFLEVPPDFNYSDNEFGYSPMFNQNTFAAVGQFDSYIFSLVNGEFVFRAFHFAPTNGDLFPGDDFSILPNNNATYSFNVTRPLENEIFVRPLSGQTNKSTLLRVR